MNTKNLLLLIIAIAVIAGAWMWRQGDDTESVVEQPMAEVLYQCDDNKTVAAKYYEGSPGEPTEPGEMPVPTGSVEVSLNGGDSMKLMQTISASGIRYANADESFVFWSKGEEALVMRDNQMDLEYTNCRAE